MASVGWKVDLQDLKKKPWKEVGGGSFGKVVSGYYLGTPVAIKCVGFECDSEDKLFEREVKTLMCSSHPCIIRCIGVAFDADRVLCLPPQSKLLNIHFYTVN